MLNLSTPNFVSGANDTITNNNTHIRTFSDNAMTVNYTNRPRTNICFIRQWLQRQSPGQPKYTGPVTIYGVLGILHIRRL